MLIYLFTFMRRYWLGMALVLFLSSCTLFLSKADKEALKQARAERKNPSMEGEDTDSSLTEYLRRLFGGESGEDSSPAKSRFERYNPSATRINDILHMDLEVSFRFDSLQLVGNATLEVAPYFHPVDSLILDAKSFSNIMVEMPGKTPQTLGFKYANDYLRIGLDRSYKRGEKYKVRISYVANPEKVSQQGSAAITSAKGLYFINANGEEKDKPTQIWTQGETEANSCWFPTIDKPNEKITHELQITVPKRFKTLSNGLLTQSKENANGTRTDTWRMSQPHAPYLVMMAIGEYAIVKDKWRNIAVDYYVEKEYEPHARRIFGHTPEMMEFFSKRLGVDYPWSKYAQVVVRDYVSGAMENTTATIHGEFIQQTPEEMLDRDFEDIIAHELIHHWFGDLVTCESWANLPLNESFATYGEYLWNEHKYGRDAADFHRMEQLNAYFQESMQKKVNLIRYDYKAREDMFDAHSYQKGGCVLHMLRKYTGDEVFFESLKKYLSLYQYQAAEIHHLRLAFEEVSGEDLNWFFDQWFLDKGHPIVEVTNLDYANSGVLSISLEQKQDEKNLPTYRLPMLVDIYANGSIRREKIDFQQRQQTFEFKGLSSKPDLVIVDAERQLLGTLTHDKKPEEYIFQYLNAKLFADRFEAVSQLSSFTESPGVEELLRMALRDPHFHVRLTALDVLEDFMHSNATFYRQALSDMARSDKKAAVRARAMELLGQNLSEASLEPLFKQALNDSSMQVKGAALDALYKLNPAEGNLAAARLEPTAKGSLLSSLMGIYIRNKVPGKFDFFVSKLPAMSGGEKYSFVQAIASYAISDGESTMQRAIPVMADIGTTGQPWFVRLAGVQGLLSIRAHYEALVENANDEIYKIKQRKGPQADIDAQEKIARDATIKAGAIYETMEAIISTETEPMLRRIYGLDE